MFTIKNLDEIQDAGTYTCHAKNELGEFKENFHLQGMLENLLFCMYYYLEDIYLRCTLLIF